MSISVNYKYLFSLSGIVALTSVIVNVIIASFIWYGEKELPLWGKEGLAMYIYIVSYFLSFILCLIATKITRTALKNRQIIPLHWHLKSQTLIDQLPSASFQRSIVLGIAGIVMAGIMVYIMDLFGLHLMQLHEFLIFLAVYVAVTAFASTVISIYRAMGDKVYRTTSKSTD